MTLRRASTPGLGGLLLMAVLSIGAAHAQTPPTPLPCPAEVGIAHLYGQWQLTLQPDPGQVIEAPLRLERHPDYAETVLGQ